MTESILITGANGQLGSELVRCLALGQTELGPVPEALMGARVIGVDVDELDITDESAVQALFDAVRPAVVINAAAFTNVDACERQESLAYRINALGPKYLAESAARAKAYFLHISTDYVYSGDGCAPYREDAPAAPVSAYGRTKWEGERFVADACPSAAIVRTSWLYGYRGKNFVRAIQKRARETGRVTVVSDQLGNPTNAADLAHHVLLLCAARATGVYHCTGKGICSWYDFAREIVSGSGIDAEVVPCTSDEYPSPTHRPAYSALDHSRLALAVGDVMRPWREALACFLAHQREMEQAGDAAVKRAGAEIHVENGKGAAV